MAEASSIVLLQLQCIIEAKDREIAGIRQSYIHQIDLEEEVGQLRKEVARLHRAQQQSSTSHEEAGAWDNQEEVEQLRKQVVGLQRAASAFEEARASYDQEVEQLRGEVARLHRTQQRPSTPQEDAGTEHGHQEVEQLREEVARLQRAASSFQKAGTTDLLGQPMSSQTQPTQQVVAQLPKDESGCQELWDTAMGALEALRSAHLLISSSGPSRGPPRLPASESPIGRSTDLRGHLPAADQRSSAPAANQGAVPAADQPSLAPAAAAAAATTQQVRGLAEALCGSRYVLDDYRQDWSAQQTDEASTSAVRGRGTADHSQRDRGPAIAPVASRPSGRPLQGPALALNVGGVEMYALMPALQQLPGSGLCRLFEDTRSAPLPMDASGRLFLPYDPYCFSVLLNLLHMRCALGAARLEEQLQHAAWAAAELATSSVQGGGACFHCTATVPPAKSSSGFPPHQRTAHAPPSDFVIGMPALPQAGPLVAPNMAWRWALLEAVLGPFPETWSAALLHGSGTGQMSASGGAAPDGGSGPRGLVPPDNGASGDAVDQPATGGSRRSEAQQGMGNMYEIMQRLSMQQE